jgi:hypothetical protein
VLDGRRGTEPYDVSRLEESHAKISFFAAVEEILAVAPNA